MFLPVTLRHGSSSRRDFLCLWRRRGEIFRQYAAFCNDARHDLFPAYRHDVQTVDALFTFDLLDNLQRDRHAFFTKQTFRLMAMPSTCRPWGDAL